MLCFFMCFHRYLKAMLFSLKTKTHVVFKLILGGQHVAISMVLGMIMEIYVFFAGAVSMISFQDFDAKIKCIGGAQDSTAVEIFVRK